MKAETRRHAERGLRNLVADLTERHTDDVEAVWRALSETEREQLRPLLEEAASILPRSPSEFTSMLSSPSDQDPLDPPPVALELLAGHWPDSLLAQLAGCLDDAQRARYFAAHPEWQHHPVVTPAPRARDALLKAAVEATLALPSSADASPSAMPVSWKRRLLGAFHRRRR